MDITPKYPCWKPHSLCSGELSDLSATGIPMSLQTYARHTHQSKTTFNYIQIDTKEEVDLVAQQYAKVFAYLMLNVNI